MTYKRLDNLANWLESKAGRKTAGLWIALGLMVAAAVYVRPAIRTVALGVLYGRMAEDPFTPFAGNYVGFRVLTPLISYLLGFRGQLIIVANLIFAAALIALVWYYFRKFSPQPGDAIYAAAVMAFSMVTLATLYYGGYCDSLTYLLVFLMWRWRDRRVLFYMLYLMALFNHEHVLFLLPWFAYLRLAEAKSKRVAVLDLAIGFLLVASIYLSYRSWLGPQTGGAFRIRYYLEPLLGDPFHWLRRSYPYWGLGLFSVFKLFWCLPVLAGISLWRSRQRREVYSMLLLTGCVLSQLVIAFDSSRMLTLAFPVVLIALVHLIKTGASGFRTWAVPVMAGNFLVPQLYTASNIIEMMHSVPGNLTMMLLAGKNSW